MSRELSQQAEEIALQGQRVGLGKRTLERHQQLAREGYESDAQVQSKQEEWMDSDARLQSLRRQRLQLQRDAEGLRAELGQLDDQLRFELAQIDRGRTSAQQEHAENAIRKRLVVTAPRAATVTATHLRVGEVAQPGQVLATLVPMGSELQVHLWLSSKKAGFVEPGQLVFLRVAAYPYQKFGMQRAIVVDVAGTPTKQDEFPRGLASQLLSQAQTTEGLYLVRARLMSSHITAFGQTRPLKPGMTLEADLTHERRAIWEWLLEPILAAAAKAKVLQADKP